MLAGDSRSHISLTAAPPRVSWRELLLVFLGYLLLGVLFTWPLALHFGAGVIQKGGLPVDAGQGVWNLWWAREALLDGRNPFPTRYLFYPLELNLFYQTLSLPNALLALPALLAAGPVAAFNTVTLFSFGLGGLGAYLLGRAVGGDRFSALVAGFVFAFGPYHIQRLWSGPMELIAIQWLPFYLLLLMRALGRRTPGSVALAALALLITTLASQYYGLYAAVYTAAHAGLAALLAGRGERLRTLLAGAAIGALWLAMLLPMLLAAGGLEQVFLEDWYERQVYHSVALVDLLAPNIQHPLWGGAAAAWLGGLHPFGLEGGAGIGLAATLLCALAAIRRWRSAWPWLALAALCLLLAMGPQLRLTEAPSPVPGPFLLLDLAGPFRNSSRPGIFIALMLLPIGALVALAPISNLQSPTNGLRAVDSRRSTLHPSWPLALLLLFEYIVAPWPIMPLAAAPRAALMNADPVPGAVLELPPRNNDSQNLLNQICHGRPLVGGYLARLPGYPLSAYPSALKGLWDAAEPGPDILPLDPAAELATVGVRFVALDLTQIPRFEVARLRERLAVPGIALFDAGETAEVYLIDPAAARPAAVLGAGWYDQETDGARVWRWMGERSEITALMPRSGPVELALTVTAYGEPRPLQIFAGERLIAEIEAPAAPRDARLKLRLLLPPGATTLALTSPAGTSPEGRRLSLSVSNVSLEPLPASAAYEPQLVPPPPPTIPAIQAAPCDGAVGGG